ncbi:hypothetical protein PAGU2638_28700 [Lysobacter sp. PAGU 2638]
MGKRFALVVAATLVLCGCTRSPVQPKIHCFPKRPSALALSKAEAASLAEAKRRSSARCAESDISCGFGTHTYPDGTVGIHTTFAHISGEPPKCGFVFGEEHIDLFDASGKYVRTIPGL